MANELLTAQTVRQWIRRKLGDPQVCVELTDEQIDAALEDAFLWWASYRGWYLEDSFTVVPGQVVYDFSAHTPEIIDITKVFCPLDPNMDLMGAWPGFLDVQGYPYDQMGGAETQQGFYSGLVQWMQTNKTAAHVLSADKDWIFDDKTKKLIMTPHSPVSSMSGKAIYMYQTPFKKDYMKQLQPDDAMLIRDRSLAESIYTLGRIRGKYQSVPAAQGNISLDGGDLLREAEAKMAALDEKIMSLMPPPSIIIG